MGSTDGKLRGSDEHIKQGSTNVKLYGTILGYLDGITLRLDVVTELGSLDGYFDGYNYVKIEVVLLGDSLVFTDDKVLGSNEGLKLVLSDSKLLVTILEYVYGITIELGIGKNLGSLYGSFNCSYDFKIEGLLLGGLLGYIDGKVLGSH